MNKAMSLDRETPVAQVIPYRAKIIVADDDESVRRFLSCVLSDAGYEVSAVPDGRVAVRLVETEAIDLLITDLVMPEQEGIETICQLAARWPDLPIIAISGAFGGGMLPAAFFLGAAATLQKPVALRDLLFTVGQVLGFGRPGALA